MTGIALVILASQPLPGRPMGRWVMQLAPPLPSLYANAPCRKAFSVGEMFDKDAQTTAKR